MESVTIGIRQGRVILVNNILKIGIAFSWRAADESENVQTVSVRLEGEKILLFDRIKGHTLFLVSKAVAIEVSHALKAQARKLEEQERAEQITLDHAILQRQGMHMGLTSDPKIQERAAIEAAWNSDLRRYIRNNIRQYQVGTPRLEKEIKHG